MLKRPNRFRGLFYNGDWHTSLLTALQLAREGTCSQEISATIDVLERQLAKTDECVHTVTALVAIPLSMDAHFLMSHVTPCVDVQPATLTLTPTGDIELTVTARGTREHVFCMAQAILNQGLRSAKAKIWVDTFF